MINLEHLLSTSDHKRVKQAAMYELRRALLPENVGRRWSDPESPHCSICSCSACGQMGLGDVPGSSSQPPIEVGCRKAAGPQSSSLRGAR